MLNTVHPSWLLRLRGVAERRAAYAGLVNDLRQAWAAAREPGQRATGPARPARRRGPRARVVKVAAGIVGALVARGARRAHDPAGRKSPARPLRDRTAKP